MLTEIVSSTSQPDGLPANFEAAKILDEVVSVAEQRIKETFPELPAKVSLKERAELKA